MASIVAHGAGWRAQVRAGALRDSGTFATKREASAWAARRTAEMHSQRAGLEGERKTLADALRRYGAEVAPGHKGERWELVRLAAFEADAHLPLTLPLASITAGHITAWKVERMRRVGPGSVLREMSLLGSVFTAARRDWHWLAASPMADVRRPPQPPSRKRVITWGEQKRMLRALGHRVGRAPHTMRGQAAWAFLMALRTGMRAGEVCGLTWANVHPAWVVLPETKNGTVRDVPLPPKAARLLARCQGLDDERVMLLGVQSLDALFRAARQAAGLEGFTFHDARHTAATRIGRTVGQPGRISFPEFCKVFGWKDPKYALVYVNPSAADMAARMG